MSSTEDARDAETLVHNADRALYWAKDQGRNATCVHTEGVHADPAGDEIDNPTAAAPHGAVAGDPAGHAAG